MINKKAELGEMIKDNLVYIILVVLFFGLMFYYTLSLRDGANIWSDIYAKEIVKSINLAEAGDEVKIDVHEATVIAKDNGVESLSEVFSVNNNNNEFCVKLSPGKKKCYYFFNDVNVEGCDSAPRSSRYITCQ